MRITSRVLFSLLLVLPALPQPARAQQTQPARSNKFDPNKLEKEDKELAGRCASVLMRFGDFCKAQKVGPRAKESYDRILNWYDPGHAGARNALGHKKTKEGWQEPKPALLWKDKAKDEDRFKVQGEWISASKQLANLHRERGLKLIKENSDNPALGVYHLRCAVSYNPFDKEANLALGHAEWQSPDGKTYYGTAEDIAFMQKMREVETFGLMLAKKEYPVEPVAELPEEFKSLELEMHGAKSKHFTVFTRGTQENADNIAKWGERALDFLEFILGEKTAKQLRIRDRQSAYLFRGFLWTEAERKLFIEKNPQLFESKQAREAAKMFNNVLWGKNGRGCALNRELTPAGMHDSIVSEVVNLALAGHSDVVVEGVMHATTWYLLSTAMTRHGALPDKSETVSGDDIVLPPSTSWWLREMRDQAQGSADFPINQLPRQKLSKYPNNARMKAWSFFTWAIARHPQAWYTFVRNLPPDKLPFPEEVDTIGEKALGKPLSEVETDWREWAAGRGACAAATGYGPPLIPEKPNAAEIAGLKRINELRAAAGLPPCEIDAESSLACEAHAHFLNLHGEKFRKWPEAHEEDPALEGFTPRGMRAGLNSVIVFGETDAADSIDGWIGTFYHRLPLLEPNTRRIGFAVEGDIIVLDMGSLQDPFDDKTMPKYVMWPFKDQKNVPIHFFGNEFPNPVEEAAPKDKQRNPDLGYPVSIQIANHIASQLKDGSILVYEVKKKGGKTTELEAPCYFHTIEKPMLKRMEIKTCVCAIPKEHLQPRTTYLVRVTLNFEAGDEKHEWRFTTGDR